MDPITTAIITMLTARRANPIAELKTTVDAYETLKAALRQKFGPGSDVIEAVEMLEKQPTSDGRQTVLKEEIAAIRADQDLALLTLAQTLLDKLQTKPSHALRSITFPAPTAMTLPS